MSPRAARLAIVVLVPGAEGRRLQALTTSYDPELAYRIRPHITVVHPFQAEPPFLPLERHCWEVCHRFAPFWVGLGEIRAVPEERLVYVEVREGEESLAALREALQRGLHVPRESEVPYRPHVTLAQPQRKAHFEVARRQLAQEDLRRSFFVERVHLMAEQPDGSWYARDDCTLDGVISERRR